MIRKMRSEDKKTYMEMAREFYHSDAVLHPVPDTYFERTADEALRSDVYAEIFLFECENEAAGYGLIAKTYSQEAGGMVWWIEEVYVREAFRSKGIGREFFAYLDKVKGSAVTRMRLEVEEDNTRAVALYKKLGLSPEPFHNVHYYYPYSTEGSWNTYLTPEEVDDAIKTKKAKKYKYIYREDRNNLDLMFSNIDDSTQTMDAIINYIMAGQGKFSGADDWQEFLEIIREKCAAGAQSDREKEIPIASWRKFYRIVNKAINDKAAIFARDINASKGETRLGDALKYIKKNEVHVIDIAKLSEDKQAYVFGDAVRTIYNLQLGEYNGDENVVPPSRIIIFIDELNKYASKDSPKNSPILHQILDVAERGRSLGVVLFAAEQFRSAIHDRVTGNCSTHAYGRTNTIEVTKSDYKSVPPVYKTMMTRLKQGEYIVQNPIFRSMLHIKFPKPIYKQVK